MAPWYEAAEFYHIYPIGLCGAPARNEQEEVTHRFDVLTEWLEHAADLGFTAVYIGPLFESTTHGYDTRDYRKVDSRLGTNEDFRRFVSLCHRQGIRVVVDGVFNHTGREFFAFQDIIRNRMRDKGAGTAANIGVNFVIAFLIFFFIFNGYTYFSSSDEEDYYEKYYEEKGFHWQGQEYPLTLQELAGPEFDGKGYIDTRNLQSSVFLSRMEIEQFYDEALSGAKGTPGYYLEYVVTKVKLAPLYGFTRASMERTYRSGENWQPMDSWGTGEKDSLQVLQTAFDREEQEICRYLLCMEDRIVKIDLSFAPDKAQQDQIVEALEEI